jgi:hypothetical protein
MIKRVTPKNSKKQGFLTKMVEIKIGSVKRTTP